jgi:hypothetical protein
MNLSDFSKESLSFLDADAGSVVPCQNNQINLTEIIKKELFYIQKEKIMKKYEFISFTPTPWDEKCLGIAELKFYLLQETPNEPITFIIQRLKMIKNEKGGCFMAATSVKIADNKNKDDYDKSFFVDSNDLNDKLNKLIKSNMNSNTQNSVFQAQGYQNNQSGSYSTYPSSQSQQNASNAVSKDEFREMPF